MYHYITVAISMFCAHLATVYVIAFKKVKGNTMSEHFLYLPSCSGQTNICYALCVRLCKPLAYVTCNSETFLVGL